MKKSIGILGGMGPLATAQLYHKIVLLTRADSDAGHIRVYIDSHPHIPDRTAAILRGGQSPVPAMRESLQKLLACGADCLLMPCNTAHHFLPELQGYSPVPFLSILDETAKMCAARFPGVTAGVLATRGTLECGLYDRALHARGVRSLVPADAGQDALMEAIYNVKAGRAPTNRDAVCACVEEMRARGAGYFILGCTELPEAFAQLAIEALCVDPSDALARAAIRFCGYEVNE